MGRLEQCTVCLDGTLDGRPDGVCDSTPTLNATTDSTGGFVLQRAPNNPFGQALVTPGPLCVDAITGFPLLAPMRCCPALCTPLIELASEMRVGLNMDPLVISALLSRSLLSLRTYVVDFETLDPSAAPQRPGVDAFASIAYNWATGFISNWERIACGVLNGANQRALSGAVDLRDGAQQHEESTAVVNLLAAQPDSVPNLSKDSEASWQLPKRYLDAVGSSFVPFVADGIAIETQLQQQPQPPRQEYPYFNRSQYIRGPSVMDVTPFNERVSKLMRSQLAIALRDGAQLRVSNIRSELGSWGRALMDTAGILE